MSLCVVCHKDSSDHTKKLWKLHQTHLVGNCIFCKKPRHEHSKELLQIHKSSVDRVAGNRKLYSIQTFGRIQPYPALLAGTYIWKNTEMHNLIPIYMSCTECDRYLGSVEEDYADVLGGMCIVCFKKMTEQVEVN